MQIIGRMLLLSQQYSIIVLQYNKIRLPTIRNQKINSVILDLLIIIGFQQIQLFSFQFYLRVWDQKQEFIQIWFIIIYPQEMAQVFVVKNGTLIPKHTTNLQLTRPAIVTYEHTIRRINEKACQCHWNISQLKLDHEKQLKLKNNQISALLKRIMQKDQQIQNFKCNLMSLQKCNSIRSFANQNQILKDITNNQDYQLLNSKIQQNGLNETAISVLDQSVQSSYKRFGIQKKELDMQECFKKTDTLMSQIESMVKNTKKYQFFYNFQKKENIIIEESEYKSQKSLDQTDELLMQDSIYLPNCDYQFDQDSFTDVSNCQLKIINQHNFSNDQQFFEKTIQQTINLKNSLQDFKKQSAIELQTMEEFYKKEVIKLQGQLLKQKRKNQLVEMTRQKINFLSDRGKKALQDLEQSYQFSPNVPQLDIEELLLDQQDSIYQLLIEEC